MPDQPLVPWIVQLYDRSGNQLEPLEDANAQQLTYLLNGIDTYQFSLPLDHPRAGDMVEYKTVAKVWRKLDAFGEPANPALPDFAGTLYPWTEGGGNVANFTFFSPLWRLQSRFVWQPKVLTGTKDGIFKNVDQSEILGLMLDYTNDRDPTFIVRGNLEPTVRRTRAYSSGQQIWQAFTDMCELGSNVQDAGSLAPSQGIIGGIDLYPVYRHIPNDPTLCTLNTLPVRGGWRPDAVLEYFLGRRNVVDQTRQSGTDVANYVRAQGASVTISTSSKTTKRGKNSPPPPPITLFDDAVDYNSIDDIGLYERIDQYSNVTDVSLLKAYAEETLKQGGQAIVTVQPTQSQDTPPIYGLDYTVGDVLPVNARRGRASYSLALRCFQVQITRTDSGAEQTQGVYGRNTTGIVTA